MEQPTFEASWPELEKRLRDALTRRRVPVDAREDVLQETALRLLRSWDRVRVESMWAFALTIALNIVRDEARKRERRDNSIPESPTHEHDAEHEALVRLELDRVRLALASMPQRQRTILLGEVGEAGDVGPSTPAVKMARMRARRRLRSLIEDVSGLVALPFVRIRRSLLDLDASLANTAASMVVRLAAVGTVSAMAIPAVTQSPGGPAGPARRPDRVEAVRTEPGKASPVVGAARSIRNHRALGDALRPELVGSTSLPPKRKGDEMNEHFGVVHKEGDTVTVGGEEQIGPYGVDETVNQTVGGSETEAELRARYDAARCMKKFLQRPDPACPRKGRLRGRVAATFDGQRFEYDTEQLPALAGSQNAGRGG